MNPPVQRNWKEILFNRRMLTCIFLGFTSGMPLYVLFQLVPAWLRSSGVDLSTIGLFALVSLPYTWKFLWSPLMDRYKPPFLGRRRGWTLITQLGLLATIGLLGHFDPGESLQAIVWLVFAVALFSASQDIVIDAYRIDILEPKQYGAGSAVAIWGWHLGGTVVGGAGGLYLAEIFGWPIAYQVLALAVLVGVGAILCSPEPPYRPPETTLEPMQDITISPSDTPRDILRKAATLDFRADQHEARLAEVERRLRTLQEDQRRARNVSDFLAGVERYDDTSLPVVSPPATTFSPPLSYRPSSWRRWRRRKSANPA